jgi:hypothetical protein
VQWQIELLGANMNERSTELDALNSASSSKGAQFGLLELFYAISVYTVGFLLSPWTLFWSTCALVFWCLLIHRKLN